MECYVVLRSTGDIPSYRPILGFIEMVQMVLAASSVLILLLNSNKSMSEMLVFFYLTLHFMLQIIHTIQSFGSEIIQFSNSTTLNCMYV